MSDTKILKSETYPAYQVDQGIADIGAKRLEEIGKDLAARYWTMRKSRERSVWESDVAEAFEAYHLMPPKKPQPYEGAANLRCVLPRIGVDSFHANVMYAIFGGSFTARVSPKHVSKDYVLEADKGAAILTYILEHEANFYEALDNADWKANNYGIAYLEPRYVRQFAYRLERHKEEIEVPEINPVTGEVTMRTETRWKTRKVKETIFDGTKIDSLPVRSVHVSPFVRNLEQAVEHDVVFKDYKVRVRDLRMLSKAHDDQEPFYMPGQVEKVSMWAVAKNCGDKNDLSSMLEQAKQNFDGFSLHEKVMGEVLDCVEAHTWEDVDGDNVPEKITVFLHPDSGTVLRVTMTPCRIVELRPRPVDERFYGESIYKAGKPLFEEWESIHNWRVNAGAWEHLPTGTYTAGGRFDAQEITWTPGKFQPVDHQGQVQPFAFNRVGNSYFQEENLILAYYERIFGINENMQGVASAKEVSATENLQVAQRTGIRFGNPMNRILGALNKLLENVWELNAECAPESKEYFLAGASKSGLTFKEMSRDDFKAKLKFTFQVSSQFDVQLMRDTWLQAWKMFRNDPLIAGHPAALYDMFKRTTKGMGIDIDVPKPPQADVLAPSIEHELMLKGQEVEPQVGEDYDEHMRQHLAWVQTEEFKEWPEDAQAEMLLHIDKTQILKQTLESGNLNKSGMFEGPGNGAAMPSLTTSLNPTQMFNNVKTGETGNSARQNLRNGATPQ